MPAPAATATLRRIAAVGLNGGRAIFLKFAQKLVICRISAAEKNL
jgi:hypothetical protein